MRGVLHLKSVFERFGRVSTFSPRKESTKEAGKAEYELEYVGIRAGWETEFSPQKRQGLRIYAGLRPVSGFFGWKAQLATYK